MPEGEIQLKSGDGSLTLQELTINAEIVSGVAIATVDMVFYNDLHKQLEGELDFPLPEDAVVCGYAYEFEGHMVPASVVEKEEARITFEKEVRAGGAVSLVEQVKGNNFKVRVYPLPPRATKRVSLTFMLDLPSTDGAQFFSLPFRVSNLSKLSISVTVQQPHTSPQTFSEYEELKIKEGNGSYTYTVEKGAGASMSPTSFKVTIPSPSSSDPEVYIGEKDLARKGQEDEVFAMVHDFPKVPEASGDAKNLKIGIVWDGSYSVDGINREPEFEILRQLSKSVANFDLTIFRNTQEPVVSFAGGDVEKLIKHLSDIIYDGGSDLANLKFPQGCDKILLFTDGFSTLSADIPSALPSSPVFAFVSSTKANIKPLKFVANKTGGQLFNLTETESNSKIVTSITKAAVFRFLFAEYDKTALVDLFPDSSFVVEEGQKTSFVGKLKKDTTLKLHYGTNSAAPSLTRTVSLSKKTSVGHSDIIPRVWAQIKSESLALLADENKKEIVELGRKYGLVTPGTSLLVLTTFDQYLKYGIEPDADALPQVHDMYLSHHKKDQKEKEDKRKAKLDTAFEWWKIRKDWWNRDFSETQKHVFLAMQPKPKPEPKPKSKSEPEPNSKSEPEPEPEGGEEDSEEDSNAGGGGGLGGKVLSFFGAKKKKKEVVDKKDKKVMKKKSSAPASAMLKQEPVKESAKQMAMPAMKSEAPVMLEECEMERDAEADDYCAPAPMASESMMMSSLAPSLSPCASMPPPAPCAPCPPPPALSAAPGAPPPPPSASSPAASNSAASAQSTASAGISIKEWSPDSPYLNAIKAQSNINDQYKVYAEQRAQYGKAPSFFLDVANFFYKSTSPNLGIRIITSILELKLEDPRLLRIVAYSLSAQKQHTQSQWLFNQVVRLRSEEPQTFRDIAMAYLGEKQYQKAVDNLWKVVETEWPTRFQHIEDEVLMHLNRAIFEANQDKNNNTKLDISKIDERFLTLLPVNIHCTIAWDTDDTCIDLHITEPTGQQCSYSNHVTNIGGFSTPDYPGCTAFSTSMLREYMIKNAMPGEYKLACNYYSNFRQDLTAGTTMWFTVTTNFGTAEQVSNTTTLRLECNSASPTSRSMYEIGSVVYGINSVYQGWLDQHNKK